MTRIQTLQNKAAKVILDRPNYSSSSDAINELEWNSLLDRRKFHRCSFIFKYFNNSVDFAFSNKFKYEVHSYCTRARNNLSLPVCKTNWGKSKSSYLFMKEWNELPHVVSSAVSYSAFKRSYWL